MGVYSFTGAAAPWLGWLGARQAWHGIFFVNAPAHRRCRDCGGSGRC